MDAPTSSQSGIVYFFRNLVMLTAMVSIPMAAVLGASLPKWMSTVRDRLTGESSPPADVPWPDQDSRRPPLRSGDDRQRAGQFVEGAATHASHEAEIASSSRGFDGDLGLASAAAQFKTGTPRHHRLDEAASTAPAGELAQFGESGAADSPVARAPERFTTIEARLRELGAAYYLLEAWGNEPGLFRFHCKMALSGNPNYVRHFEATDTDALTAMEKVLGQVEAWRRG